MTKQLTRSRDDRWIAGVCGGIADYTGIDTSIVRVVLVVCTVLGAGSLVLGYLAAWVLVPRQPRHDTVWAQATDAPSTGPGPAPQ
ncbi:PspC domain-containing protein [Aeromicrobium sp. CFBP 8757]|uniref:PspC domain-containing protein n=1 Tax=Aeromicrobium sp. CFBP 8757 TaxID=2775288 RepID=UPI001780C7E8|nr:PspC domain-containing protein [Aeromicrobium sp. CFBP 8757]MBD8607154.1 PspC domain-containing protein [Aeromicrobium sp. CFBP 8757]